MRWSEAKLQVLDFAAFPMRLTWRVRTRHKFVDELNDPLLQLQQRIHDELGIEFKTDGMVIGLKVWLLPPWYYRMYYRNRYLAIPSARLHLIDLCAALFNRPRLISAGSMTAVGVGGRSRVGWSIGKGRLSAVLHDSEGGDGKYSVLIHGRDWERGVERLHKRRFIEALPPEVRIGRSKHDFQKLRDKYTSAMTVPLVVSSDLPPIGCITAHTGKDRELSVKQAKDCVRLLEGDASRIASVLVEVLHFPFTFDSRSDDDD